MKKNVIIADSSELILKGLKSIITTIVENEIIFSICFSDLKEQVKSVKDVFLIIDYTSEGFSLDEL